MKQSVNKRILSLILCLLLVGSSPITAFATSTSGEATEEIMEATSVLVDVEEAQQSLKALAAEREIPALLYLKDIYTIKTEPDINSNDVASIATGQQVYITGVGEDRGHNIWYQVTYSYDGGDLSGYIQREYLAFSDERMREWEDIHIRSMRMFTLRRAAVSYADVEQFPESYRDALYKLKQQHPNWTFVKMETGLDWNYVVNLQSEEKRSLVSNNSPESWKDGKESSSWAYASDEIIKYYLDPRNALTENLIFQFEQLTYNPSYHSVQSTQKVIEGTFMDGLVPGTKITYATAFMNIAAQRNTSPVLMAARVRQEQGSKGSLMISGTYPGFEGLYNHYNIGASGSTYEQELISGLTKAREEGWTTPMLSLSGGSAFLSNKYIRRGQDTLYLQKFDVDSSFDGVCWHQYMQNIEAPKYEALSTYKAYTNTGIVNSSFVFKIPVFRNMPSYACTLPGSKEQVTLNVSTVENLPVDSTAVLVSYINGSQNTSVAMNFTSSDTKVATVDSNGVITGVSPGKATITCKRAQNADSATAASCTVTVIKADISLSKVEKPNIEVTYSPKQTLSSISLPKGFAWVDGKVVPVVNNKGYSVTYNPDSSKYNTLTFTLPVTVKKATVDKASLTLPTGLVAVAGDELMSVALPKGYAWDNASQELPKKAGTYQYSASYCVDEVNYEVLKDIRLSVEVVCKSHEFGGWTGSHADCTNNGVLSRSCGICGETEKVTEPAIGHEYVSKITKEPTLITPGVRTYTCTRCQDTYDVEIPVVVGPHKHDYVEEVTIEPTCEGTGIKKLTCACKDTYTEVIKALGHELVDGACTRCDYKIPTLPQHTHSYTLSGSTETCTSDGVATYICGCGESYTENKKALGHNVVNGKCTRCDYTEAKPDSDDKKPVGGNNNAGTSGGNGTGTPGGENNTGTSGESTSGSAGGSNSGSTGGNNSGSAGGSNAGSTGGNNSGTSGGSNAGSNGGNNAGTGSGSSTGTGSDSNAGDKKPEGGDNNTGTNGGSNNGASGGDSNIGTGSGSNIGTNTDSNAGDKKPEGGNNTGGTSGGDNNTDTNGGNNIDANGGNNTGTPGGDSNTVTNGGGNTNTPSGSASDEVNSDSNKEEEKPESGESANSNSNQGFMGTVQNIISSLSGGQDDEQNNEQAKVEEIPIQPQDSATQSPQNDNTTQNSQSVTSQSVENNAENTKNESSEEGDTVVETEDAVKITMKHSTMLNKDKLAIVTNTNRSLELVMADNVKWNIDLSGVDSIQNINVDMAVKMNEADIPEDVITTLPQDKPIILMSLSHEGAFEFEAKLTVPVNKLNVGKYANLYYYNPETKEMEFIAASLVAEDGSAEFMMAHASDYAIVIAENSLDPNLPQEVAEGETEEEPAVETIAESKSEIVAPSWLTIVIIVVVVAIAAAGIVFGIRFFKKKSEDSYYFDEEDEELIE